MGHNRRFLLSNYASSLFKTCHIYFLRFEDTTTICLGKIIMYFLPFLKFIHESMCATVKMTIFENRVKYPFFVSSKYSKRIGRTRYTTRKI